MKIKELDKKISYIKAYLSNQGQMVVVTLIKHH
jgi:hypothetical protein